MKMFFAILIAKFVRGILKLLKPILNVNGTHVPGKIALKIEPKFLEKVGKPKTIITVTGTNGKTTTCNMIIDSLEANGYKVLNNRNGSNVQGGITTALLDGVKLNNKSKYDIAVLEVDERSSFKIYPYIKPTYAVVTNLFRDSLKRNAHSEYIFDIINKALPDTSTLVLNADDLISNRMKAFEKNNKIFFGIDKLETDRKESINIVNDARICPNCHEPLEYEFVRYHHIGKAYCKKCGYKSPDANYLVTKVDFEKNIIKVKHNSEEYDFNMISDSIFNIYNEIVAITVLSELGLKIEDIQKSIEKMEITKARYDKENVNGINVINHLAKGQNPIACSIVFDYVKHEKGDKEVILLIEDYHDNRESSENIAWLYDCDFEFLKDESIKRIAVGGIRANDIKFRLLLAGVEEEKIVALRDESEIPNNLLLEKGEDIYILYDMYEQSIVDNVNKVLKEKLISGGVE